MSLHLHTKVVVIVLLLAAGAGNLSAQTRELPGQEAASNRQADFITMNHSRQVGLAIDQRELELNHDAYAAIPASIHAPNAPGLRLGIPHEASPAVAAQGSSSTQEIRYIEHASPMEMQRVYARAGAKGYVMAFATINKKTGRCTIHLPTHVSTGRYDVLKKHWLKHCRRGDYHGPGEGIEVNPDYNTLLAAYADWLDADGAIPHAGL